MALNWDRFGDQNDGLNITGDVRLIAALGSTDRLRRTIVDWSLVLHNPGNAMVDDTVAYGAYFGLEVTGSSSSPAVLTGANVSGRDMLWFESEPGRIITGLNTAIFYIGIPGDGLSMHVDTSVQRGVTDSPLWLWSHWALVKPPGGGTSWNIRRGWNYSVLTETI